MKKFQLQYYILRLDLNISFVISLKLLYTTKVGYLCHCLHLHTVLLHIFVCITVKIYAIKLRSMVVVGGSKNLEQHFRTCDLKQCTQTLTQCQYAYRTDTVSVRPTLKPHISGALPLSETLKIIHFCNILYKFFVNF